MKGLLLKDLLNLKSTGKAILLILAIYMVFSIITGDMSFVLGVTAVMAMIMPISTFGIDEKTNWNKYAMTLPINKRDVVKSKYMMQLILIAISLLLLAVSVLMAENATERFEAAMAGIAFVLAIMLYSSICITLAFKFGPEKAKFVMMGIILLPTALLLLISNTGIGDNIDFTSDADMSLSLIILIVAVIAVLSMPISYFISVKIYEKKEF